MCCLITDCLLLCGQPWSKLPYLPQSNNIKIVSDKTQYLRYARYNISMHAWQSVREMDK